MTRAAGVEQAPWLWVQGPGARPEGHQPVRLRAPVGASVLRAVRPGAEESAAVRDGSGEGGGMVTNFPQK